MSFVYRDLNAEEKKKIEEDVQGIVNSFGETLSSLGDLPEEDSVERDKSFREENGDYTFIEGFREKIFENAPNKNEDFIIAEKKKW